MAGVSNFATMLSRMSKSFGDFYASADAMMLCSCVCDCVYCDGVGATASQLNTPASNRLHNAWRSRERSGDSGGSCQHPVTRSG